MKNFNSQMLPANATGRDNINVDYIVTAPAAGVRIPNKSIAQTVDGEALPYEDKKQVTFSDFPLLEEFT